MDILKKLNDNLIAVQTDRQTDRQTNRQTGRQTDTPNDTHTFTGLKDNTQAQPLKLTSLLFMAINSMITWITETYLFLLQGFLLLL